MYNIYVNNTAYKICNDLLLSNLSEGPLKFEVDRSSTMCLGHNLDSFLKKWKSGRTYKSLGGQSLDNFWGKWKSGRASKIHDGHSLDNFFGKWKSGRAPKLQDGHSLDKFNFIICAGRLYEAQKALKWLRGGQVDISKEFEHLKKSYSQTEEKKNNEERYTTRLMNSLLTLPL